MSGDLSILLPLALYLIMTLAVAVWARSPHDRAGRGAAPGFLEEYFIGGRAMGGFVLAMSIIASYTSASSFVGGPGVAYKLGLSWVLLAMIQVPTTFLTLGVLGKRFAIAARRINAVTLSDFLRARYGSEAVAILCSVAMLVFFMAAMLAQFIGGARLFSENEYHEKDRFMLKVKLLEERPQSVMYCEVLRTFKREEGWEYGCQFLELTEEDQEKISQNIFDAQRKKRM